MKVFLLLAAEHIGHELDKLVGGSNRTEMLRPGEYLLLAGEQTANDLAHRLRISRKKPGVVLPLSAYSGVTDARIIETLGNCDDRRHGRD